MRKGNGWRSGEATLKNGELVELFWTTHNAHQETTALIDVTII